MGKYTVELIGGPLDGGIIVFEGEKLPKRYIIPEIGNRGLTQLVYVLERVEINRAVYVPEKKKVEA